ncbi:MAG: hypothetical protein WEB37_08910 [Bacteroidota bacterium]
MSIAIPVCLLTLSIAATGSLNAQGYNGPLTIQGLEQTTMHSVSARATGGISLGITSDVGAMFQNPASLYQLSNPQISAGGFLQVRSQRQTQHFAPVRYYSNFSLLMEGLTHLIPDPSSGGFTVRDTVQRPYDAIRPNWARSGNHTAPLQGLLAVPFTIGEFKVVAGAGVVEYANVDHFYQNNNVLMPALFLQRPLPTFRPPDNAPIIADWYQYIQSREGAIRGYGGAVSAGWDEIGFSFGISGMILNGSSDDFESLVSRGRLTFYSNAFRLDSVYSRTTSTGTSDYEGEEFTLNAVYLGRFVRIAATATLPMEIRRIYSMETSTDSTGIPIVTSSTGRDRIQIPLRATVSLVLMPRENLTLGLEYKTRPYASAVYRSAAGVESSPWLSSSIVRIGAEYRPLDWLSLRGGLRGQSEVFQPDGNPIEGEPVTFSVYTAGFGVNYAGVRFNLAYEYGRMKYQDVWGSAVSFNSYRRNTVAANIEYDLPVLW